MTNEYGSRLDRNGYAESIVPGRGQCQYCGRLDRPLQRHEVFHGAYREKSKRLGCWIEICDVCHDRLHHKDAQIDRELKAWMQANAIEHYHWTVEQFIREFGKNYEIP